MPTPDPTQTVQREREWAVRCGVAAILGALLGFAGFVLLQSALSGDTNFDGLVEAHDKGSTIWLSGICTGLGYLLLTAPLVYLFRAIQARSARVKSQLIGVVVLGPVLLGISGILLAGGTQEAADTYVNGEAKPVLTRAEAAEECRTEAKDSGAEKFAEDFPAKAGGTSRQACEDEKLEEDEAQEAIRDASLVGFAQYAGLAGGLSLVVAMFYCGLWAMRTGLLSRFWGSLGMAVGVAGLFGLSPFLLLWFLYLGILLTGVLPTGKPPAWEAGEAIPWPTPGEKAATELEPASEPAASERKKRKQRDEGQSE